MNDLALIAQVIRDTLAQLALAPAYSDEQRELQPHIQAAVDESLRQSFPEGSLRTTISVGGTGKPNLRLLGTSFWPDVEVSEGGTRLVAIEVKLSVRPKSGRTKETIMSPGLLSKSFRLTISLLLVLLVLPAWGAEKIVLDGSTGMLPLAKALVTAYQQKSSDPQVEIGKGLGTGARLRALAEGKIQIALASHGIKPEDIQKGNLKVIEVAKGAIVFAVNASVSISNITEAQVCDIYSGKIRSWQPLGGSDSPMAVLTRPPTEVDPEVIRAKIGCFKELKEVETAKMMARGGDMAKGLAETPHAIGMTSMTVVEQSGGKVKALALNGVAPIAENVKNGRYFLTRDFYFVIKGEPTPSVKIFLDFVLSPAGGRVILANGAVSLR